jgi:hypothetical protein
MSGAEFILPGLISGAASIGGGILSNSGNQETKLQRKQRKTIDEILASIKGTGAYSDLFNADDEAFEKGFRAPAEANFRNRTAPQIQQEYISNGMHRGTGLDDALTRAGVDFDSLLNQQYYQFQQDALNRKANALNGILGGGAGAPNPTSTGQAALQATGGYLTSDSFDNTLNKLLKKPDTDELNRKGFENNPGRA